MSQTPVPSSGPKPRAVFSEELAALAAGVHQDPHRILGAHSDDGVVTFRALRPLADAVVFVTPAGEIPAEHEHHGIWVAVLEAPQVPDYRLEVDLRRDHHHRRRPVPVPSLARRDGPAPDR